MKTVAVMINTIYSHKLVTAQVAMIITLLVLLAITEGWL